jgi:ABC-type nitrate/sulfonate/bicarbonate transport system substrate-binding protein
MPKFRSQTLRGLAALGLCVAAGGGASAETIVFGVQPATQPIYIARANGAIDEIEQKHGVEIEFISFAYGAPQNQAMAAGEVHINSAGMGPAIVASARLPAKLLAISILEQTAILVPEGSDAESVADLEGKRVAFPGRGSQQYPLLLKALADAGLSESDIELFQTDGSQIPTLLMNGSVDAGITWDPHVSNALAAGHSRVLVKAEDIMPIKSGHYIGNGVYALESFIEEKPELVQDLVGAIVEAIDFIVANPDDAIRLWSTEIGFPEDVIRFSIEQGISVYSTDVVPEASTIDAYTAFLKEAGILQPEDAPKIDASFAEAAVAAAN